MFLTLISRFLIRKRFSVPYSDQQVLLRDPNFTIIVTEVFLNDHLTKSLRMAHDTIEVFKVLFPSKALIKSSEYKKRFMKIFERSLSAVSLTKISHFWLDF